MSHPSRRGPDRTIILRIPRVAALAQAIDLAAVRAGRTPPEFIKATLAAALDVPTTVPTAAKSSRAKACSESETSEDAAMAVTPYPIDAGMLGIARITDVPAPMAEAIRCP